jgi:hypothetical protein
MTKKSTLIANKSGLTTELITEGDSGYSVSTQDVAKTIEYARSIGEQTPNMDMRHVAEVPLVIYEKALHEGWANDQDAWKKWLNDPINKPFRSWHGKV